MERADNCLPSLGLDLARVYLLQRDLLAFSSQLEDYIDVKNSSCKPFSVDESLGYSSASSKEMIVEQKIKLKAMQFILHLSALAPLAPLVSEGEFSSSLFGLEQLLMEVTT